MEEDIYLKNKGVCTNVGQNDVCTKIECVD